MAVGVGVNDAAAATPIASATGAAATASASGAATATAATIGYRSSSSSSHGSSTWSSNNSSSSHSGCNWKSSGLGPLHSCCFCVTIAQPWHCMTIVPLSSHHALAWLLPLCSHWPSSSARPLPLQISFKAYNIVTYISFIYYIVCFIIDPAT